MKSMTAFSRQETSNDWGSLSLEIRTVNHRYLDINLKLAEEIRFFEPQVRQMIAGSLSRGRVDLIIKFQPSVSNETGLNKHAVKQLFAYEKSLKQINSNIRELSAIEILLWPGVLGIAQQGEEVMIQALSELLSNAITDLVRQRAREGDKIRLLLIQRIEQVEEIVHKVKEILSDVTQVFRSKFQDKLNQMQVDVDDHRLEQELTIFLAKQDVAEELDRMELHLHEVKTVLNNNQPSGRRLDFLMQELNREANTLTSKSVDIRLNNASVDIKVLIDQMREQIQNIE